MRFLTSLATDRHAAVLCVEDIHWADRESVRVVEFLADAVLDQRVLVIVTRRDGVTGPGPDMVDELIASRRAQSVPLVPLSMAQVAEMAESCTGDMAAARHLVDALYERSEGLPFLVEELLATVADTTALEDDLGRASGVGGGVGGHPRRGHAGRVGPVRPLRRGAGPALRFADRSRGGGGVILDGNRCASDGDGGAPR